jgi:hypothetical protein
MAGWGDDPVLVDLQAAINDGWAPTRIREERDAGGTSFDVVTVSKESDGDQEFRSDHLAFHRYVEGLMEDFGLSYS